MAGRGSPLRNEIRKPNEPRFNQLVSSLGAANHNEPSPRTNSERSKLISSDLVSATIARSPILAAKRSSGGGRAISTPDQQPHRPQSTGPPVRTHSIINNNNNNNNYFPPSSNLQRSYSGTTNTNLQQQQQQAYPNRTPFPPNNFNNSYHTMSYSGGIPEHVRQQRPPSPPSFNPNKTYPPPTNSSSTPSLPPPTPASLQPTDKANGSSSEPRPILFYVKAVYDYDAEIPEEIALHEGQVVAVLATQLDGWWEGEIQDPNGVIRRGIFPSNFTEPVSL